MNRGLPLGFLLAAQSDYLARLLRQSDLGWGLTLAGMVVAFGRGAVYALSPGHGKTIVAAYPWDSGAWHRGFIYWSRICWLRYRS